MLTLGAALGAGLLLGTVLGMSVGHESAEPSPQMLMWVTAIGPGRNTSTLVTW